MEDGKLNKRIRKISGYSETSTDWTLLEWDFLETNCGNKLIYDQIGTALADMCFSSILITRSAYEILSTDFSVLYWINRSCRFFQRPVCVNSR